ncbi:hypothetical protein B0H10DRAFT_1939437 [Mycena sp. CBHHK59/15]|nr:hypothetical protein B0H10DRAFT_1939437 [Mycena sp. CBHHK59/15]
MLLLELPQVRILVFSLPLYQCHMTLPISLRIRLGMLSHLMDQGPGHELLLQEAENLSNKIQAPLQTSKNSQGAVIALRHCSVVLWLSILMRLGNPTIPSGLAGKRRNGDTRPHFGNPVAEGNILSCGVAEAETGGFDPAEGAAESISPEVIAIKWELWGISGKNCQDQLPDSSKKTAFPSCFLPNNYITRFHLPKYPSSQKYSTSGQLLPTE